MIVVTTPTGNVGAEVARLLARQQPVLPFRLAARHPKQLIQLYGSAVDIALFDFSDSSTWPQALAGISSLFLVCPQPGPGTVRTEILPFIDAAIQAGCQHIIFLSIVGAQRVKLIPHARIERYIEESGISYTLLRSAYFMQNFLRQAPTHNIDIVTRQEIFIPAGKGRLSLVDARDIAQIAVDICREPILHARCAYELLGSEALTMYEIADVFSTVLGRTVRYTHPSLPLFWYRLRQRRVSWIVLFIMSVEYTLVCLGLSGKVGQVLEGLLQRSPTTFVQFVTDYRQRWLPQED